MSITEKDLSHVLDRTMPLWEQLRGKRIFVTGGTGFFGKWLLASFAYANRRLDLGARMTVLSRGPEALAARYPDISHLPGIEFVKGDVRDIGHIDGKFDLTIHAATDASAKLLAEEPDVMFDTIVQGTRNVLELAGRCGVSRLLMVSSGAVYGRQPAGLAAVGEDYAGGPDPTQPESAYGEGKRAAELLCGIYGRRHGIEIPIARGFAFVGPYLDLDIHFAVGNFIRDGLAGGKINVLGDGTPLRSYLYAADLAIWLWTILLKGRSGRAYNVGSNMPVSIAELARRVSQQFAHHPEVSIARTPDKDVLPARYVPSTDRAETELGLQCWIDLDEALKRTVAFHQQARS